MSSPEEQPEESSSHEESPKSNEKKVGKAWIIACILFGMLLGSLVAMMPVGAGPIFESNISQHKMYEMIRNITGTAGGAAIAVLIGCLLRTRAAYSYSLSWLLAFGATGILTAIIISAINSIAPDWRSFNPESRSFAIYYPIMSGIIFGIIFGVIGAIIIHFGSVIGRFFRK